MQKGTAIISILIAFVGGVLIGNLTGKGGASHDGGEEVALDDAQLDSAAGAAGDVERVKAPVTDAQPSKGSDNALVTIVEISDFECPFCSRVNPTIAKLMSEYGDKLRVVWRNNPLPFHKNAPLAHQAAMEAFAQGGDKKFWAMHDKLFGDQRNLTRENLEKWAGELGLDMGKFKKALDSGTHKKAIDEDQALAAKIGARGTPHFVINGRKLSGAQPIDKFKEIIDDEIKRANSMVKSGINKKQLYAAFMKSAKDSPSPAAAKPNQPARRQPDPKAVYKVPVGDEPFKGKKDALVTIVEVSDFECPFCSRVNGTIQQIEKEYDDVRIVWFNNPLPFHKNAPAAHAAALEAFAQGGNKKFWKMHDLLFANQKALSRADLEKYAKEVGLNMGKFKKALDSNVHQATIDKHQKLARSLGATGTPSFFVNGRNIRGAQPFPNFKSVIDEELAKAKAKLKAGTPRANIYAETIKNGKTSPQFVGGDAAPSPAAAPPAQFYKIPAAKDAPFKGGKNAKVLIQEFSDFECPFCGRVNPTIKQVMDTYGNKVKVTWRNYPLPFHKNAPLAHQAAWEVFQQGGSDKFWKYHDILFANQRALSRADLEKYAGEVGGINMGKFKAALDSGKHKARIDADMEAIKKAGARIGTPSFFINGKLVQGAQPFPAFKAAIDEALKK